MKNKINNKDERATFIENISCKFGYNFVTFALLLDVIYRALKFNEASWDLLIIIITSGLVMTIYKYKQKILDKAWIKNLSLIFVVTFIFAFLATFIMKKL